jgi:cytidine deaminase
VSAGARRLRRAAVVTDLEPPAAPCGACRQVLAEFGPSLELVRAGPATTRRASLADLLPLAFGPEQLA